MEKQKTRLTHISLSQLKEIIHDGFGETEMSCFLYDASGELLVSSVHQIQSEQTTSASEVCETNEQVSKVAQDCLEALRGNAPRQPSDKQYLTEVIKHQGKLEGVLVARKLTTESTVLSFWKRVMKLTRCRIEDVLSIQEEIDELSEEILNDYRQLGLIHKLGTKLVGSANMNQAYHHLLEDILEVIEANWGCIFQFNQASHELQLVHSYPMPPDRHNLVSVRLGEGIVGKVLETGVSVLIESVSHPDWDASLNDPLEPPLMCAPLQVRHSSLGVIVATRESGASAFTSADLKIFESAALQSASVMMNVRLLGDLRQSNQDLHQEISDRKQVEIAMKESEERFRRLFEQSNDAILIRHYDGQILEVNNRACEMLGYSAKQLRSMSILSLVTEDDCAAFTETLRTINQTGSLRFESRFQKIDGEVIDVEISSRVADQKRGIVQGIIRDITERKQMETQLRHNAFHDTLTGLPNRALFLNRLEHSLEREKRRSDYLFGVLFLDLDRFKVINDSLGHSVGDELLIEVSRRLKSCMRPEDTIARLGGDEFAVLLDNNIRSIRDTTHVAERLQTTLMEPFYLSGHEVITTASIGIVMGEKDYNHPEDVLRDADSAMYRAKVHRNHYEIFDSTMHADAVTRLKLETNLRRAIECQEFRINYQPVVSLEKHQIIGFEALLRWHHPDWGLVSPQEFIPIAEETGLIVPIGTWALREACRQMCVWHRQFPIHSSLTLNVNLSAKQFTHAHIVEQVHQVLTETGLNPRCLNLEITESLIMETSDDIIEMLSQLKALNVQLHMDDFGTGYSSLSYLHRFPIDTLKIDRAFISNMDINEENYEIVRTIVALTRNLDMQVTAEGIETFEQLIRLKALSCDKGQGYYFSRPVDAQAAEQLILSGLCKLPQSAELMPAL